MLGAQLSVEDTPTAYQRLERMPFVRASWDGLAVHEAVKSALALRLRSIDPRKHLRLRRAAWRQLQTESRDSGSRDQWRYTSDMLYLLLDQPILREGFFPSAESPIVVDPAKPEDIPAIRALELARA